MSPSGSIDSAEYVAVWVGDDPQENDDNPLVDGDESRGPNPGRGVLALRVQAYGESTLREVEATVARAGSGVTGGLVEGDSLSAESCRVLHVITRLGCRVPALMPKRNE